MAYTNAHKIKMIRNVCNLYREHKKEGVSTIYIYRRIIYPQYPISLATLYNYLSIPIERKERELQEKGQVQLGFE